MSMGEVRGPMHSGYMGTPLNSMTDRQPQKHYLSATSLAGGKNITLELVTNQLYLPHFEMQLFFEKPLY